MRTKRLIPVVCDHLWGCGCVQGAPCCLDCLLPVCVFEPGQVPLTSQQVRSMKRAERILEYVEAGMQKKEIAKVMGIGLRTVFNLCPRTSVTFTPTKT